MGARPSCARIRRLKSRRQPELAAPRGFGDERSMWELYR